MITPLQAAMIPRKYKITNFLPCKFIRRCIGVDKGLCPMPAYIKFGDLRQTRFFRVEKKSVYDDGIF